MSEGTRGTEEFDHQGTASTTRSDKAGQSEPGGLLARNRLIPIVIASALFMDLMDSAALALALPTIAKEFVRSTTDLRLALTAYAMTVAVLVPASAWMAGRFGARRVFTAAMMLFVTGSVLCGLSDGLPTLIGSRILQGAGGAMMTPVGRAIMVGSVDREAMVRAMAWYTLPAIAAPLAGPPLAGMLIELASWRWIFFINVPVGLIGIIAVIRFVPKIEREPHRAFDMVGFLLCGSSILAILGLVATGVLNGQPWPVRALSIAATIALTLSYVRHALWCEAPLIDLGVLRHKTFRLTLAAGGLQRIGIGAITIILPMQLQVALGLSPLIASQVPAIGAIGSILSRFACPLGLRLMGFGPLMVGAAVALAGATLIPIAFEPGTPVILMAGFMALFALIRATFFMSINALSYADVEGAEIGHSSVLFSILQQVTLGLGYTLGGGLIAALGGATDSEAYAIVYSAMAALSMLAALVISRLPYGVGEEMRGKTSA